MRIWRNTTQHVQEDVRDKGEEDEAEEDEGGSHALRRRRLRMKRPADMENSRGVMMQKRRMRKGKKA